MANKPSLAETHPEIAKEWHPFLNGKLTPKDVTPKSSKKVWWKCDEGDDHEWDSRIENRSNGTGCPVCRGLKVVKSNCLSTLNPELANKWHPTKNENLKPDHITVGSDKKVWWKCPEGDDHEWFASPGSLKRSLKTKSKGCPMCSNSIVVLSNCLATINLELAKEWHPTKNGELTPYQVTGGSGKKVWWKCTEGDDHEWEATIKKRFLGRGCPVCAGKKIVLSNCLATINPKLAKEWHPTKNGELTPYQVTGGSRKKVWWKCPEGDDHEWVSYIQSRHFRKIGCGVCRGFKVVKSNCLQTTHPELAKIFNQTRNGTLTAEKIHIGSYVKVWWKCPEGDDHEWIASPVSLKRSLKTKSNGCPVCAGLVVVESNSLKYINPKLAKEWHPTKNGELTANDIVLNSGKKVWWKCPVEDDHEWITTVANRSFNESGCPVCAGKKVVKSNCLTTTHPKLIKEWNFEKNKISPDTINFGAHVNVWWKCKNNPIHEWKTSPRSKKGCPYCDLTPQSRQELVITFELMKLFKDINPKGYKTILDGRLRAIDIFITRLNLAIEFDGSYWHKDKRTIDKIKSKMLFEKGYKVIRIREEPLKKIYDTDIISKQPYNGKQVTNDLLSVILSIFDLGDKKVLKIKEYQAKDGLQNEKGLDRYIDKILTEKASKSSN